MRDVAHQAMGAHALGMQAHVRNMLRRFAENITAERDWCSLWEIDRHDRPAHADYRNDSDFWYNLPANFDVLDAAYRMSLWSGDQAYLRDPAFSNFYDRTVTDYVRALGARRRRGHEASAPDEPRSLARPRRQVRDLARHPRLQRGHRRLRGRASTCSRPSTPGSRPTRASRRRGATSPRRARGCGRRGN